MTACISFACLPPDVIDRLLTSLSDFETLSATIKTCKLVYGVFQDHPKSIVRAITVNIVGGAFSEAVDLLVQQADKHNLPWRPREELLIAPTRDESAALRFYASVVSELEEIYTICYKNDGRLTCEESTRFWRALYRFWILCGIRLEDTDEDEDDEDEDEDDDDDGAPQVVHEPDAQAYLDALQDLPDEDLFALNHVRSFLAAAHASSCTSHMGFIPPFSSNAMSPPQVILCAIKPKWLGNGSYLRTDLFEKAMNSLLDTRNISAEKRTAGNAHAIIHDADPLVSQCHGCPRADLPTFLGRSYFAIYGPRLAVGPSLQWRMKGRLANNPYENRKLVDYIAARNPVEAPFDWLRFYDELCDVQVESDDPDASAWRRDERYCVQCIDGFVTARLYLWWLAKKVEEGAPVQDGCWYGYSCRTQMHKQAHAERLNHLCRPTRGDGYAPRGGRAGGAAGPGPTPPAPAATS